MTSVARPVCAEHGLVNDVLATLQERIGPGKFNAWFRHGTRLSVEDGCVKVAVPNPFVANWIETHYHAEIASAAAQHTGSPSAVVVTIDPSLTGELRRSHLDTQAEMVSKAARGLSRPRRRPARSS